MKWGFVGAGAIILTGGIAYYTYRKLRSRTLPPSLQGPNTFEEDFEGNGRPDAVKILMWSLVNSMSPVLYYYKLAREGKGIPKAEIRRALEQDMQKVEAQTCAQYDWQIEEYYAEIARRERANDPELKALLATIEELVKKAIDGEKPVVNFEIPAGLSKEVTLNILRWTMLADIYVEHKHAQNSIINTGETRRKEDLLRRFNLAMRTGESYTITLQRAYFTYRTNDEEFDTKAREIVNLKLILETLISRGIAIKEFVKDPFEMGKKEMEELYDKVIEKYMNVRGDESWYKEDMESEMYLSDSENGEMFIDVFPKPSKDSLQLLDQRILKEIPQPTVQS